MSSPFDALNVERRQRKSAVTSVIETFERLILTRKLRPGDRLPSEFELTQRLGTSRGSIREAMKILASYGVIDIRRGDGTYVSESTSKHLFDHLLFRMILSDVDKQKLAELREAIEVGLVRLVIRRAGPPEIAAIEEMHGRMVSRVEAGSEDARELTELDVGFHLTLARATANELVQRIYEFTMQLFEPSIEATHHVKQNGRNAVRSHGMILDAIRRRDPVAAEAAVRDSIQQWWNIT